MIHSLSRAAWLRVVPFVAFIVLLAVRGVVPLDGSWGIDPRWIYGLTVVVVGAMLAVFWKYFHELLGAAQRLNLKEWALSVLLGVVVFAIWIKLDAPWMRLGEPSATFRPVDAQGLLIWPSVVVRWLGAALLVPVMEELFWRSFLMRWLENADFEQVDAKRVGLRAVVLSTFVFVLAHTLWLAAIVAGLAYAWIYIRTGKLWAAVVAHAVTNGLLGVWVVLTGQWAFW